MKTLLTGTRVQYNHIYLRSIARVTRRGQGLTGRVTALTRRQTVVLATVAWDDGTTTHTETGFLEPARRRPPEEKEETVC